MEDRLGVGPGAVAVTLPLEFSFEFRMVIDLAVEDDPRAFVPGGHRLGTPGDVDDRQPTVCEPHATFAPQAFSVRSAVKQHVLHSAELLRRDHVFGLEVDDARNSAHGLTQVANASSYWGTSRLMTGS